MRYFLCLFPLCSLEQEPSSRQVRHWSLGLGSTGWVCAEAGKSVVPGIQDICTWDGKALLCVTLLNECWMAGWFSDCSLYGFPIVFSSITYQGPLCKDCKTKEKSFGVHWSWNCETVHACVVSFVVQGILMYVKGEAHIMYVVGRFKNERSVLLSLFSFDWYLLYVYVSIITYHTDTHTQNTCTCIHFNPPITHTTGGYS